MNAEWVLIKNSNGMAFCHAGDIRLLQMVQTALMRVGVFTNIRRD